jgi:hypothetical protein
MPLKYRVNHQFIIVRAAKQRIRRLIWPVNAQRGRKGDKKIVEKIVSRVVVSNKAISHLGPGEVVNPCWVWGEELRGPRRCPFG